MPSTRSIRKLLATAVAAGALLGGTFSIAAATSASALPQAIDDFQIDPCVFDPEGCGGVGPTPDGPDDKAPPPEVNDCAFAEQFCDGPGDLTTPEAPPTTHPEVDPDPEINPDVVVARPTFTG